MGPGKPNIYRVNQDTYDLGTDDFVLIWPMEMHAIVDADSAREHVRSIFPSSNC